MPAYSVSDRVRLSRDRTGVIRFIGDVVFAKGVWFGVELDKGHMGRNDGSYRGSRYFTCPEKQGLFLKETNILGIAPAERKLKETKVTGSTRLTKGDTVILNDSRVGKICFVGMVKFGKGEWIGVQLEDGHPGNNDGSVKGKRYFKCRQGQGLFVTKKRIKSKIDVATSRSAKRAGLRAKRTSTTTLTDRKPKVRDKKARTVAGSRSIAGSRSVTLKDFPMRDKPFFHGKMSKHGAEDILKKRGQWLLRQEKGRKLNISVRKSRNLVDHVEVNFDHEKKHYMYSKAGARKKIIYRDFDEMIKSIGGKKPLTVGGEDAPEPKKKAPKTDTKKTKTSTRNKEKLKAKPSTPKKKKKPEPTPPEKEPEEAKDDSDDVVEIITKKNDSKPKLPLTREEAKAPEEEVKSKEPLTVEIPADDEDDNEENAMGSIANLFDDVEEEEKEVADKVQELPDPTDNPLSNVNRIRSRQPTPLVIDVPRLEADHLDNDEDEILNEEDFPNKPPQRKRSAEASEMMKSVGREKSVTDLTQTSLTVPGTPELNAAGEFDKSRRTPESRRDSLKDVTADLEAANSGPLWFLSLPQKTQMNISSFFSKTMSKLANAKPEKLADGVYEALEDEFSFTRTQIQDLYLWLSGEPLPKGTSDIELELEAEDGLGASLGSKESQTALTEEELQSVATVFNTLAMDSAGIDVVVFHTVVKNFNVPFAAPEEINTLFQEIDSDQDGYVSWDRFVEFLGEEQKFNQEVEQNRLLLIASIKEPYEPSQNDTPDYSKEEPQDDTTESETKTLHPAAQEWVQDALDVMNDAEEEVPSLSAELGLPVQVVPGGYTKPDLLNEQEDLFELNPQEAKEVLVQKLRLCCVSCDFNLETKKEMSYRKAKQELLSNISQYVSETKKWFSEDVLIAMKDLVTYNIFRSLPYQLPTHLHDPDDDPKLDPCWEHLHSCFEILLRLVIAPFTKDKLIRKHLDNSFLEQLVNMFMSEDPRERDYLKVIIHRFYGKFLKPRPHIRKTMHEMLYNFIYILPFLPGVCEILEILGSIINGFSIPLKTEHKEFLENVLIPLHKATTLMDFSAQLNYCITQFVAKDAALTSDILQGLLSYWPLQSSQKEVLFLTEIEAILDIVDHEALDPVVEEVFDRLGMCMCSVHFQVSEQALNLTANETISYYITRQRQRIVPILYPYLQKNLRSHWHDTVRSVTVNILATLREMDSGLYKKIVLETKRRRKEEEERSAQRKDRWAKLKRSVEGS